MADYTIPSTGVVQISGTKKNADVTVPHVAGRAIIIDANGNAQLANASDIATANVAGITLNDAAAQQPIAYALPGSVIDLGDGGQGEIAVLSAAANGGIAPSEDLVATDIVSVLGVFEAAGQLRFAPNNTGIEKA